MMKVSDCNFEDHISLPIKAGFLGNSCNLERKQISSHLEQHLIALMVLNKNNAASIVTKQKVFINYCESEKGIANLVPRSPTA